MSTKSDVASLPRHRQLAAGGALLLFISLFFPLVTVSFDDEYAALGALGDTSVNGWDGIGVLLGLLALALVVWEALRLFGQLPSMNANPDLVTAILAGSTALFGIIQFFRAVSDIDSGYGISIGLGFGAYAILILSLVLGAAGYLSAKAAGIKVAGKDGDTSEVLDDRPPAV